MNKKRMQYDKFNKTFITLEKSTPVIINIINIKEVFFNLQPSANLMCQFELIYWLLSRSWWHIITINKQTKSFYFQS